MKSNFKAQVDTFELIGKYHGNISRVIKNLLDLTDGGKLIRKNEKEKFEWNRKGLTIEIYKDKHEQMAFIRIFVELPILLDIEPHEPIELTPELVSQAENKILDSEYRHWHFIIPDIAEAYIPADPDKEVKDNRIWLNFKNCTCTSYDGKDSTPYIEGWMIFDFEKNTVYVSDVSVDFYYPISEDNFNDAVYELSGAYPSNGAVNSPSAADNIASTDWKKEYLDFISTNDSDYSYMLADLDGNSIPELFAFEDKGRKPVSISPEEWQAAYSDYCTRKINKVQMANQLGISRTTLDKLLKKV